MRTVLKCAIGQWSGRRWERGPAPTLSAWTALMIAGCGSGGGMTAAQTSIPPPSPATTAVTMALSSTANDQLSEFDIGIQGVSTVNGTVTGLTTSGDFTVYSVSMAPYELFSSLATKAGQTTLLGNPGSIEVYADTSTAMLTSSAPAPGDTLRF